MEKRVPPARRKMRPVDRSVSVSPTRQITPTVIGVLALLAERPGLSQAELARLARIGRMTAGTTVVRAISSGFVRRTDSSDDARRQLRALLDRLGYG